MQRPGIGCCNCASFYHFACVNLEDKDIEYIEANPVGWLCPNCNLPHKRSSIVPATPLRDSAVRKPASGTGISQKTGKVPKKN